MINGSVEGDLGGYIMGLGVRERARHGIVTMGGYFPWPIGSQDTHELLETGRWFREHNLRTTPWLKSRRELYPYLATTLGLQNLQVLYLEFGVWYGNSMRAWSALLQNPLSELHGFDSFEGLPEDWKPDMPKGHFNLLGSLPTFDDPRVVLHPGWFEDTLPDFGLPKHDCLVVHLDADLYSSTLFVLNTLREAIQPGTILLFDEFRITGHERRALSDFLENAGMQIRFLAGSNCLMQAAFARVV